MFCIQQRVMSTSLADLQRANPDDQQGCSATKNFDPTICYRQTTVDSHQFQPEVARWYCLNQSKFIQICLLKQDYDTLCQEQLYRALQ